MVRPPIVGVVGGGTASPEVYAFAVALGGLLARGGALVLCGGRSGVMEGAARGAREAGGRTIGILPMREGEGRGNPYLDCEIYTGLGDARNYVNAQTSDALIALEGEAGTLSEIALAIKLRVPVVYLRSWRFLHDQPAFRESYAETPEEAVETAFHRIGYRPGASFDQPLRYPLLQDQSRQREELEAFLKSERRVQGPTRKSAQEKDG